jgi:hypothetical protein
LQAVIIGWLATGGVSTLYAQASNANDAGAWAQAREAGTIEAYEGYLGRFPTGAYAHQAFRCVVELTVDATEGACVAPQTRGVDSEGTTGGLSLIDVY